MSHSTDDRRTRWTSRRVLVATVASLVVAAAVVAVAAVVWGWAVGQYPWLLVDALEIADGSGSRATLQAMLVSLGIGVVLFVPPLLYLLSLAQRGDLAEPR